MGLPIRKIRSAGKDIHSYVDIYYSASQPHDLLAESHSLRSSLWGGVDASSERQDEAGTSHSVSGRAEPTDFLPREHSTPSIYPRLSQGEGTMLLGKKTIRFTTPDEVYLKVSSTSFDNMYRRMFLQSESAGDAVIGSYSTPSRHSVFAEDGLTPYTSNSKKLFFKATPAEGNNINVSIVCDHWTYETVHH